MQHERGCVDLAAEHGRECGEDPVKVVANLRSGGSSGVEAPPQLRWPGKRRRHRRRCRGHPSLPGRCRRWVGLDGSPAGRPAGPSHSATGTTPARPCTPKAPMPPRYSWPAPRSRPASTRVSCLRCFQTQDGTLTGRYWLRAGYRDRAGTGHPEKADRICTVSLIRRLLRQTESPGHRRPRNLDSRTAASSRAGLSNCDRA
jgi:hypothetical protein